MGVDDTLIEYDKEKLNAGKEFATNVWSLKSKIIVEFLTALISGLTLDIVPGNWATRFLTSTFTLEVIVS